MDRAFHRLRGEIKNLFVRMICVRYIRQEGRFAMPKPASERSERFNIRIRPAQKAIIARAAALSNKDMTDFILDKVLPEAEAVIKAVEKIEVSERDFKRILDLLEHPPKPNAKLRAAIAALPDAI